MSTVYVSLNNSDLHLCHDGTDTKSTLKIDTRRVVCVISFCFVGMTRVYIIFEFFHNTVFVLPVDNNKDWLINWKVNRRWLTGLVGLPSYDVNHVWCDFWMHFYLQLNATNRTMVSLRTANESDMLRSNPDAVLHNQCVNSEIFRFRYPHV